MGDRDEEREESRLTSRGLASQFRRGQMVRHPTFGVGRIAEVSDMGQHTRAVVEFNAAGRKTLMVGLVASAIAGTPQKWFDGVSGDFWI